MDLEDIFKLMILLEDENNIRTCKSCGRKFDINTEFRDNISLKEYTLSGLCQSCQDQIWK